MTIFKKYLNEDLIEFEFTNDVSISKQYDKNLEENKFINAEIEFKINELYENFLKRNSGIATFLKNLPIHLEHFLVSLIGKNIKVLISSDYNKYIKLLENRKRNITFSTSEILVLYEFKKINSKEKIRFIIDLNKKFKNKLI